LALAGGAALSAASAGLFLSVGGGDPWLHALIGFLGLGPFAIAGLALARAWGGVAPGPGKGRVVTRSAAALAMVSGLVLIQTVLETGGGPGRFSAHGWLANIGFALAVPVLLLVWRAPLPPKLLRLAPYTLGVYLVHPFFIQGLRVVESRFPWLSGTEVALILPNAMLAGAMSLGAVVLLARSPLRRAVI
jgi:surface polysaccharide O-acyltransferase-like enzyme